MKRLLPTLVLLPLLFTVDHSASATPDLLRLPAFPFPALVRESGAPKEMSSVRLLRELHRGGVHGSDNLETSDSDYALLRGDSLGNLAGWLESACSAVDANLLNARTRGYDGSVFSRLLTVATSLAVLRQGGITLAMPIGVLICQRRTAWGDLPGDGATDAYIVFVTDNGMLVYDPPTRQLTNLADFPNKAHIGRIRF